MKSGTKEKPSKEMILVYKTPKVSKMGMYLTKDTIGLKPLTSSTITRPKITESNDRIESINRCDNFLIE